MMTKDSQFEVISLFSKSNEINFNSFEYKFCVLNIFDQSPTSSFFLSFPKIMYSFQGASLVLSWAPYGSYR